MRLISGTHFFLGIFYQPIKKKKVTEISHQKMCEIWFSSGCKSNFLWVTYFFV